MRHSVAFEEPTRREAARKGAEELRTRRERMEAQLAARRAERDQIFNHAAGESALTGGRARQGRQRKPGPMKGPCGGGALLGTQGLDCAGRIDRDGVSCAVWIEPEGEPID